MPRFPPKGIALLGVLWVLAVLTAAALALSAGLRQDLRLAANQVAAAQARRAAEAGVELALLQLLAGPREAQWRADGSVQVVRIAQADVSVSMLDEAGKLDLNEGPEVLLDGLFRAVGVADDERRRIVDAILDWRDPDATARPHGAEDAEYRAAGKPYGSKDAPFASVDELQLVLGVTPALYRAVRHALSVHSGQLGVNAAAAPREVLLAIPGADAETVASFIAERERHRAAGLPPPSVPESLRQELSRVASATYSIHAEARLPQGASALLTATVDLRRPGRDARYTIRDWRYE